MEEAADADHVVISDKGSIIAEGTPLELKNRFAFDSLTLYGVSEEAVQRLGEKYERVGDHFRVILSDVSQVKDMLLEHPELFNDFEVVKGKMDDVFLNATGKKGLGGELS
jgi:multidrug/hemolysin transport system ATP-binding protein